MSWIDALPEKKRRGSFPRCLQLMDGNSDEVAKRITELVNLKDVIITPDCKWMPLGKPVENANGTRDLNNTNEAELTKVPFIESQVRNELKEWWLAHSKNARVPNWDIASEAIIGGQKGLLLVEAKAHAKELKTDGKSFDKDATDGSKDNHDKIGDAIKEANDYLNNETGYKWNLSRDSHYQLSNRFAWSWKLASMGVPVVLVYLGFLNADIGEPFNSYKDWEKCVLTHSKGIVPGEVWEQEIKINETGFIPVVRAFEKKRVAE